MPPLSNGPRIQIHSLGFLLQPRRASKIAHVSPTTAQRVISTYGYEQAKCLVYYQNGNPGDVLDLHTHSISPPHQQLVTLRNLATPLNPADINQIQGSYPTAPPFRDTLGTSKPAAVPGNEGCFEVISVGSGVKSLKRGDWVIPRSPGIGTWRTHLQTGEEKLTKIPNKDGLTALQVATISVNPITAWRMLTDFEHLQKGDWWIQNGANSGVGRAALQLGRRWGLRSIAIARRRQTEEEQQKLEAELKDLGADVVVTEEDVAQKDFSRRIKDFTAGKGVRLGLNCVGGDQATQMAKVLDFRGTLVTYGAMSKQPIRIGAAMLIFKDIKFRGFWVSKWADENPDEKRRTVEEVLDMYRDGSFKDVPYDKITWDWNTKMEGLVLSAQQTLDGGRKGKGVFVFGET